MARRRDLFARLSLDYADHPKIAGLTDAAFRTHVEMILYSRRYLTDGRIAKQIAKRWPEQALSELLANDDETPSLTLADNGDYLIHGFAEMQETRAEVEDKRRIRAEAGRLGGLARGKQSAKRAPSKMLSKNVPETETETETTKKGAAVAAGFDNFWAVYPRKEDKGRARPAWNKAVKKTDPDTITAAAAKYAQTVDRKEGGKYIKLPATWLNAEAWENEAPQSTTAQSEYDLYPRAPRRTA